MSGVSSRSMNWNEVGPTRRNGQVIENEASEDRPLLRAIIFDFSAVANLDTTGVQSLIDLRNEVSFFARTEARAVTDPYPTPGRKMGRPASGM